MIQKGINGMKRNCPGCGAPITDESSFCSHCGTKLPDNVQKIQIEDAAKIEEVRLKYEMQERERQEINESKRRSSKAMKIKRWVSWIFCIVCLCIGVSSVHVNQDLGVIAMLLSCASGIYALIITFASFFRKR